MKVIPLSNDFSHPSHPFLMGYRSSMQQSSPDVHLPSQSFRSSWRIPRHGIYSIIPPAHSGCATLSPPSWTWVYLFRGPSRGYPDYMSRPPQLAPREQCFHLDIRIHDHIHDLILSVTTYSSWPDDGWKVDSPIYWELSRTFLSWTEHLSVCFCSASPQATNYFCSAKTCCFRCCLGYASPEVLLNDVMQSVIYLYLVFIYVFL